MLISLFNKDIENGLLIIEDNYELFVEYKINNCG